MSYQFWGILSGVLGLFSGAWYLVRIFRREVHPHITSWLLWTLIALAMLATSASGPTLRAREATIWRLSSLSVDMAG